LTTLTVAQATVTGGTTGTTGQLTVPTTGLIDGDMVQVNGVNGLTGVDGPWYVHVVDATHLTLLGATAGGAWTSGGTVTLISR